MVELLDALADVECVVLEEDLYELHAARTTAVTARATIQREQAAHNERPRSRPTGDIYGREAAMDSGRRKVRPIGS
jgi:hypothetical protein